MAFLDIERIINQKNVGSRFKLVHLAGLRAKELNNPDDNTFFTSIKTGQKVTSRALSDLVCNKVAFEEVRTEEKSSENEAPRPENNEKDKE